jgi:hypothetical protein
MAGDVDINLLMQGFLRQAKARPGEQPAAAVAWLMELQAEAVAAVAAGDIFVNSTAYKGQASGQTQQFNAQQLLTLTEACLKRLELEAEYGEDLPPPNGVRYGDFSSCY